MLCGLFLALGCDRVLGIEELPHASIVDSGGVDTPAPTACETCEDKCSAERTRCEGDATCAKAWRCVSQCPLDDPMCRRDCEDVKNPGWSQSGAYLDFDRCRRRGCMQECYGTAGFAHALDDKCSCIDTACAATEAACVQSGVDDTSVKAGACERHLTCLALAPNPDNYVVCDSRAGVDTTWDAFVECAREAHCSDGGACAIPTGELACKSNFSYGVSTADPKKQSVTLQVTDISFQGVEGAQVTACSLGQCSPCTPSNLAGSTTTTDKNGYATVVVPMAPSDFTDCIEVKSPSGSSLAATMIYTGRRIHTDEKLLGTVLFDPMLIDAAGLYAEPKIFVEYTEHGQLFGTVHDCLWWHVSGAFVSIDGGDASTRVVYLESGMPMKDQTTGTNNVGAFGIFNVPVGKHTVTVTLGKDGPTIARLPVEAAAGKVTDVNTFPMSVGGP
jgi:hypothetical protein